MFLLHDQSHSEFKLKIKEEILEAIKEHVSYARSKFEIVISPGRDTYRAGLPAPLFRQQLMRVRAVNIRIRLVLLHLKEFEYLQVSDY